MSDKKIIIFENQFTQFSQIRKLLIGSYIVYPDKKSFIELLHIIKIVLDDRYDSHKKKIALSSLREILDRFEPDALIIDHNLIGLNISHSNSGIDLAKIINSELKNVPFLFLSQSLRHSPEVIDGLKKLKKESKVKFKWCQKGYSSSIGFDPEYFKKVVMTKLKKLLEQTTIAMDSKTIITNEIIEPDWEEIKKRRQNLGQCLVDSLKNYWRSKDENGKKRNEIPSLSDLEQWLHTGKIDNFGAIDLVPGFDLKIIKSRNIWVVNNKEYGIKARKRAFKEIINKHEQICST